jgi:hypothetical protein
MVNSISSKLKRIEMSFTHTKVDTICIKDFPQPVTVLARRIGPFKMGNPYTLEYYLARIFVEEGILKFDENKIMNSATIQKINFMESTNAEPRPIDDHVYVQAIQRLSIFENMIKQDKIPRREFSQLFSDVNDLIRVRLAKIIRLATQPQHLKIKKVLTEEERILFDYISNTILEWQNFVNDKFKKTGGKK